MYIPEIEQKIQKKFFVFQITAFWIGSGIFSQSSIGLPSSAVSMLRNIRKISPNSTGDIFQINFSHNEENTW